MSTADQAPPAKPSQRFPFPQREDTEELQVFIDNFKENIIPKWRLDRKDNVSPLVNEEMRTRITAGLHDILRAYRIANQAEVPEREGNKVQDFSASRAFEFIFNAPQMRQWPVSPERKWACARQMVGSIILYACDLCPEGVTFNISTDTIPKGPPAKGWTL